MDLETVFMLDLVQKGSHVTREQAKALRGRGLIEGRYPKMTLSPRVAGIIGTHEEYVRKKGLDTGICKEIIAQLLRTRACTRSEVVSAIAHALPEDMNGEQRKKHVSNLLQELRKERRIRPDGAKGNARWMIDE